MSSKLADDLCAEVRRQCEAADHFKHMWMQANDELERLKAAAQPALLTPIAAMRAERDAAQAEVARLRDALERIVTADDDYGYHIARAALESKT